MTGLDWSVLQIKTKIVSRHTADSKPVKQEVKGRVILLPLVFPDNTLITVQLFRSMANVIKLFKAVSYDFSKKAREFFPGMPSLMFAGKARSQHFISPRLSP
jgi:hypothetical protein